jgi:hypothetical protein
VIITSLPLAGTLAYDGAAITLNVAYDDIGKLTFTPAPHAHGPSYASFGFQVQDNGGTSDGGVDTSETQSITVAVTPVNDAPTSTNDAATTNEATALVLSPNDFGTFADIDGDSLQAVQITQGPATGTLERWNGSGWRALFLGETVFALSDLTSGSLRFVPGTTNTSLQFQVSDGRDWSAATYTLTLNVTRTVSPVPNPDPMPAPPPAPTPPPVSSPAPVPAVQTLFAPVPPSASASGLLIPPPSAQPIVFDSPRSEHTPQVFDSALYPHIAGASVGATYLIEPSSGHSQGLARGLALWTTDDSYTTAPDNDWRAAVHPDVRSELAVWRGIPDQRVDTDDVAYVSVPWDSFSHTHSDARVTLEATLADGSPLPPWMNLDSRTGVFELVPPPQPLIELAIRLTARDAQGREAATVFRIQVGEGARALNDGAAPTGRTSLSDQLREATRPRTSDFMALPPQSLPTPAPQFASHPS